MATCLECGGHLRFENPFYVCTSCGTTWRKFEYEKARQARDLESWDQKYGDESDEKQKRADDYRKWYEKGFKHK